MANASALVNFGTTGLNVGDYTYSLYALSAPGYLPLNSYTNSYLVSSYPALGALIVPVLTPVAFTATARTLPSSQIWRSVAYGNNTFVAIANGGTGAGTSADGISWTARTLPVSGNRGTNAITFGNGTFVALTFASAVAMTSTDGITWASRTLPASVTWTGVAYGNGLFVAVASGPSTQAASSPDGITWTSRTLPSSSSWTTIAYGNGVFVAVDVASSAAVSSDGITWTLVTLPAGPAWGPIGFGNGVFVIVAGGAANTSAAPAAETQGA